MVYVYFKRYWVNLKKRKNNEDEELFGESS